MSSDAQPHRVVPPSRRRDKPVLSCSLCRRRKLKCDRKQPCRTCVDRGLSLSCTYTRQTGPEPKAAHNVHDRIDQLEQLVTTLMDERTKNNRSPLTVGGSPSSRHRLSDDGADGEVPGTPDRVKLEDDATSYTNPSHWTSILDGITELKDQLDQIPIESQLPEPSGAVPAPDLFFGGQRHATKNEILAAIPPRNEADEMVVSYFASMDMAPILTHRPTFLREASLPPVFSIPIDIVWYDRFWERPFETPVMWLGLLFSIFAVTTRFKAVLDNPETPDLLEPLPNTSLYAPKIDFYREKAVQCLILADYSKCPQYTVEALLQYFVTEYLRSQDSQFGVWLLVGIIVRTAFRMGYHREPSRFSNISPFKAEMRRRLWTMIVQLDLMSSTQVGLPRMIQPSLYDVNEPRNLVDEDLDENMSELPPSRPNTEATVMLYTLIRNRVLGVFSRIADLTNSTTQPSYRDVMELDRDLRAIYDGFPTAMKATHLRDFEYDASEHASRRLSLGISFLKATLMLHRPYLLLGRTDTRYEYSRFACLDSALGILEYQKKLDAHARPGGRLWTVKWRLWSVSWRFSSIINHDFLLATTILSLELDRDLVSPRSTPQTPQNNIANRVNPKSGPPTQTEIIDALSCAYTIWLRQSEKSHEARKIAAAVRHVLRKANVNIDYGSTGIDQETPIPQFDFASFAQPRETQNLDQNMTSGFWDPNANSAVFSVDNTQFGAAFLANDPFMDIPGFNWGGVENEMTLPALDPTMQNTHWG